MNVEQGKRYKGYIKKWDFRGFGFALVEGTGNYSDNVFIHYKDAEPNERGKLPSLALGMTIEFEIEDSERGYRALHITILKRPEMVHHPKCPCCERPFPGNTVKESEPTPEVVERNKARSIAENKQAEIQHRQRSVTTVPVNLPAIPS